MLDFFQESEFSCAWCLQEMKNEMAVLEKDQPVFWEVSMFWPEAFSHTTLDAWWWRAMLFRFGGLGKRTRDWNPTVTAVGSLQLGSSWFPEVFGTSVNCKRSTRWHLLKTKMLANGSVTVFVSLHLSYTGNQCRISVYVFANLPDCFQGWRLNFLNRNSAMNSISEESNGRSLVRERWIRFRYFERLCMTLRNNTN